MLSVPSVCCLFAANRSTFAGLGETGLFRQRDVDETELLFLFVFRQGSQRIKCDSLTVGLVTGLTSVSSAQVQFRQADKPICYIKAQNVHRKGRDASYPMCL